MPTRRGGSRRKDLGDSDTDVDYKALYERAEEDAMARDREAVELRRRVASLEIEVESLRDTISRVREIVG